MEVWVNVPSVPRLQASSLGRLRLKPVLRRMPNGGVRTYGGKPIIGQWDGERYIWQHRGRSRKVARLICEAFHGPPKDDQVCMHLDENARNNAPSNLQWGTQKENLNAPRFLSYCRSRTGDKNPRVKGSSM